MARVKGAANRRVRRRKLFKRSKGFFLARRNTLRQAHEAVMKAEANAYAGRKQRKRQFRRLWIVRINAALAEHGMKYGRFIHGLKLAGVAVDRKILAGLAVDDPGAFAEVVKRARSALDGTA